MDKSRLVYSVLSDSASYKEAVSTLEKQIKHSLNEQDIRHVMQTRVTIRFIYRWQQFKSGQIKDIDFLASLRDYVLSNERLPASEEIIRMVKASGSRFGLYADGAHFVNATTSLPDWLSDRKKKFIETVYGKRETEIQKPNLSMGDAYICNLTPFKFYRSYEQKVAVHTALTLPAGYTMLLSLPTGGGKSLVTQMLSAMHEKLTLVIVPTVALALDQKRVAKEILSHCIPEEFIKSYSSGNKHKNTGKIISNVKSGKMRLLITSPEAILKNKELNKALQEAAANKSLGSIVMDEAHMIPDWGAQFRPEFQLLAVFRKKLLELAEGEIRTFLLSATLADESINILKDLYSEDNKWVELRSDALRNEPRFCFVYCDSNKTREQRLLELCRLMPKPLIVYVLSPGDARYWFKLLKKHGLTNAATFTGETGDDERSEVVQNWNKSKIDIVVATSAFGMGVDKPDVRTVIHACVPESLNRFYQEVGRGGRDGWPSLSILCVNPKGDEEKSNQLISGDSRAASSLVPRVMEVKNLAARWLSMKDSPHSQHEGDIILLDTSVPPSYFSEEQKALSGNQNMRWNLNVLLFLHRYKYIQLQKVDYYSAGDCYYVTVKLNDIKTMTKPELLMQKLEVDREIELQKVRDGFNRMKDLVKEPLGMCWGGRFVTLYPYAYEICGGCPAHDNQTLKPEGYNFGRQIPSYILTTQPTPLLNEYIGSFTEMLIPRSESSPFNNEEMNKLAIRLNQCGINVWVIPENCRADAGDFSGLVLTSGEFIYTCRRHPSVLSGNIFVAFNDGDYHNEDVYKLSAQLREKGIRIVYYARESMFIRQEVRTIANIIDGYTREPELLLEGG